MFVHTRHSDCFYLPDGLLKHAGYIHRVGV